MARTKTLGRWHVTSRVFAALIPGFVLTNSAAVLFGFLWPSDKVTAVAWVSVLSFVFYVTIIMWVFSVKRLRTVWLGLVGGILATTLGSWLMYTLEVAS